MRALSLLKYDLGLATPVLIGDFFTVRRPPWY
ncbi:hypothetical protein GGQ69_001005 [Micrococcus sp. TA1]|nr:hypothetical protein [Micrococcus sp. TA1]